MTLVASERLQNYAIQHLLVHGNIGRMPLREVDRFVGSYQPTGPQARRIMKKVNAQRISGGKPKAPKRRPAKMEPSQPLAVRTRPRHWRETEDVNLPQPNECPNPSCRQSGDWSTNPCLTASGAPAKKAHAGRVL